MQVAAAAQVSSHSAQKMQQAAQIGTEVDAALKAFCSSDDSNLDTDDSSSSSSVEDVPPATPSHWTEI